MADGTSSELQTVVLAGQAFSIHKKYRIIKSVGHGAFGVVMCVRPRLPRPSSHCVSGLAVVCPRPRARSAAENTETGQKVAIKKVLNAFSDVLDAKRILREVKLMKHFTHENVRWPRAAFPRPCARCPYNFDNACHA